MYINNCMMFGVHHECAAANESTAGADASVEALKLYDIKLLIP